MDNSYLLSVRPCLWSSCFHRWCRSFVHLEADVDYQTTILSTPSAARRTTWTYHRTPHTPNLWRTCPRCGKTSLSWPVFRRWAPAECACGSSYSWCCVRDSGPGCSLENWGPSRRRLQRCSRTHPASSESSGHGEPCPVPRNAPALRFYSKTWLELSRWLSSYIRRTPGLAWNPQMQRVSRV